FSYECDCVPEAKRFESRGGKAAFLKVFIFYLFWGLFMGAWQKPSMLGFCAWLIENVGLRPTFSRCKVPDKKQCRKKMCPFWTFFFCSRQGDGSFAGNYNGSDLPDIFHFCVILGYKKKE
ncbi:MAG: hypothetical protein K2L50_08560, partial [Bacteroidales bacterium]|nr:hypothetical protein [Bacteroidales bacterium]